MRSSSAALLLVAIGCFILCANARSYVQHYKNGYNRNGYDRYGYNRHGYNKYGYNRLGYNRRGYNRYGYDRNGYNKQGYSRYGYSRLGYDKYGYDSYGYDKYGYNRQGYNYQGYNRHGVYKRPVYTGCYKVQRCGSYQYWNKYRCSCVCHSVVVVVKVVKHARYGRDVDADPLPADTEEPTAVPVDTEPTEPTTEPSEEPSKEPCEEPCEEPTEVLCIGNGCETEGDHQRATRGIRYKYITYKKKVIRSSICPNGKRPSYYNCSCY